MNIKKMFASTAVAAMALTALTGCGGSDSSRTVARVNLGSEPKEMNTFLSTDAVAGDVLRHCVEGLTTLDANDKAAPGVATDWSFDEATTTWTFNLRQDSKWQNGEPVTAHDFVFAWTMLFDSRNAANYAGTWAPLIDGASEYLKITSEGDEAAIATAKEALGFKAVDDYTFTVKTTAPYKAFFEELMAFYNFAPINEKLYTEFGGNDNYAKDAAKFGQNGAFIVESWTHESDIVLKKNADYWNADEVKLEEIDMQMIKDSSTALNAFEDDTLDMVGLTGEQAENMKKDGVYEVLQYSDGANAYFEFNTEVPGLNNKKVRKALAAAIDRDAYVKTILKNNSTPGEAFTPNSVKQGTFTEKVGKVYEPVTDDYAAVKAMFEEGLAEEGLTPADFKISLLGDTGDSAAKSYAFFQEQWRQHLGIEVQVDVQEFHIRLDMMDSHDFDIVFALWGPDYNDPMTYLDLWVTDGGNNHTGYSNPEYDALVEAARTELDTEKRDQMLIEVEKIIAEDMPVGVVYYRVRDYAVRNGLTNVVRTSATNMDLRYAYFE